MRMTAAVLGAMLMAFTSTGAARESGVAGERHGTTTLASAAVRDAERRDALRYTVWYPAPAGSRETALTIGPPDAPLFDVGRSSRMRRSPVIACRPCCSPMATAAARA